MRRFPHALFAAILLPLLAFSAPGCGGDDSGTDPQPDVCGIEIFTPEAGTHFYSLDGVNLRWHASGGGTVSVELLKGGALVEVISPATENDGYFFWSAGTLGAQSGDDFALRVASTTSAACADTVPIALTNTVGCVLDLTIPPDSTLVAGQEYLITWTSENTGGNVDLELWSDIQESRLVGVIDVDQPDNGSYLWRDVDSFNQGTGTRYYFRIVDTRVDGCEDMIGPFAMTDQVICYTDVTNPVGGETLPIGSQLTIRFDPVNSSGTVYIRLYAGGILVPGGYIADDVDAALGEYVWTVSDFDYDGPKTAYRIVVVDTNDQYCVGRSGTFTIP